MSDRPTASVSLSPGGWLFLGPFVGTGVGAVLYLGREEIRPLLSMPWDDLLLAPAVVGQGVFAGMLVLVLAERLMVARRAKEAANLTTDDRATWAGQARQLALTSDHPRPLKEDRRKNLQAMSGWLAWQVDQRWLLYALLSLTPALAGLLLGLRGLRVTGVRALPALEFFAPLVVGTIEGLFLLLLLGIVRWKIGGLLRTWLKRCIELETAAPAVQPAAETVPVATAAVEQAIPVPRLEPPPPSNFNEPPLRFE